MSASDAGTNVMPAETVVPERAAEGEAPAKIGILSLIHI